MVVLGGNLFQSLPTGDLTGNLVGNSPVGSLLEGNPLKGDLLDSLPTGDLVGNSPVKAATSVLGGSSDVLGENNLLGGLLGKREHTKRKLKEGISSIHNNKTYIKYNRKCLATPTPTQPHHNTKRKQTRAACNR